MLTDLLPWFLTRTISSTVGCPWVRRQVTLQVLTCDGRQPVGVMGCSERDCPLPCLKDAALPPA